MRRSLVIDKQKRFNCLLNWQRLSDDRSEAGSLFQSRGPATSNDLSPRRVLDHGMTHGQCDARPTVTSVTQLTWLTIDPG